MYVAVYLVLVQDNKVLLLQRANTGFEDGNYSVPAGHVENNESVTDALAREVKEEIGITIQKNDIQFLNVNHRKSDRDKPYLDFFFTTSSWQGEITNCEPHKCDHLAWYDLEHMPENMTDFVKRIIMNLKSKDQYYSENGFDPISFSN